MDDDESFVSETSVVSSIDTERPIDDPGFTCFEPEIFGGSEEEETREFLYEIANAYSTLLASLGDVRALAGSYVCGFVSPRWRTRYVGTNRSNHADAFRSSFAENDARPFAQKFRPVAPLECHHGSIAHA